MKDPSDVILLFKKLLLNHHPDNEHDLATDNGLATK